MLGYWSWLVGPVGPRPLEVTGVPQRSTVSMSPQDPGHQFVVGVPRTGTGGDHH
jgi:hypothetical protein